MKLLLKQQLNYTDSDRVNSTHTR